MNIDILERAATGKWYSILSMLGIDAEFLTSRHGPCPMCQGKDRFVWDDKDGRGTYFCHGCGPGSGFQLLEKFHGWDFPKAADEVAAVVNCASESVPKSRGGNPRGMLRKTLKECSKDRPFVIEYLKSRGLSVFPSALKQHPALPYFDDGRQIGTYPAMLAVIYSPQSEALSIHRTYLDNELKGSRKKVMNPIKPIAGCAIRLFREEETLGIAEGIETAIAAYELGVRRGKKIPVWSVLSTTLMEKFEPPALVKHLVIFGDNDLNYAGHKSAYALAHKLVLKGLKVSVVFPGKIGDFLDVLNGENE